MDQLFFEKKTFFGHLLLTFRLDSVFMHVSLFHRPFLGTIQINVFSVRSYMYSHGKGLQGCQGRLWTPLDSVSKAFQSQMQEKIAKT